MALSESSSPDRASRSVPLLPRDAWAALLKDAQRYSPAITQKKPQDAGVMSVEPLHAFCLLDPFMRFVQVSPVIAELTGYSAEELSCMGLQEIVSLETMEDTLSAFERVDSLGWSHHTVRFHRKDGVEAEARIDAIRLTDDQYLAWIREIQIRPGTSLKVS